MRLEREAVLLCRWIGAVPCSRTGFLVWEPGLGGREVKTWGRKVEMGGLGGDRKGREGFQCWEWEGFGILS